MKEEKLEQLGIIIKKTMVDLFYSDWWLLPDKEREEHLDERINELLYEVKIRIK